jgi:hypothetical protein
MKREEPVTSSPPRLAGTAGLSADAVVVAACAALAFTSACMAHEVLGHAGACLAGGGTVTTMTSSLFACSPGLLLADLGGPCANLVVAAACLLSLRGRRPGSIARLLLVLAAAFNLWWLAGCLLKSAVATHGDFAYAARLAGGAQAPLRTLFGLAGFGLGVATCRMLGRQQLTREALWLAYGVAGAAACVSALSAIGPIGPALREAALESFGGMAWLGLVRPRAPAALADHMREPSTSRRVVVLAVLALCMLVALGHGVDRGAGALLR